MNTTNNEPKFTSEPRTPERDEEIVALATIHFADKEGPDAECFDFFLERGASLAVLENIAVRYWDSEKDDEGVIRETGLPYVSKLLDAGFTTDQVREFIVRMCTKGQGMFEEKYHARAFLANSAPWQVFDSVQSLSEILIKVGEPCGEKFLEQTRAIALAFGRMRKPEFTREDALAEAGWRDMMSIMKAVAKHFLFVTSEQMKVLRTLPKDVQIEAGWFVAMRHDTIPLIGKLIARHFRDSDLGLSRRLSEEISRKPHRAPVIYRWYLLGVEEDFEEIDRNPYRDEAYRQFPRERVPELYRNFFLERRAHLGVRADVELAGWKFAKLVVETNTKDPDFGALQVEFTGYDGTKIVIRHRNKELGQELKEGDEVIIPTKRPDDWTSVREERGRVRIYEAELQHAAPPTKVMQADPKKCFYLPNPKRDEQKK